MASLRLSAFILLGQLPSITACYGTDTSGCGKCGRVPYQTSSNGVSCAPPGDYACPVGQKCSNGYTINGKYTGYCATSLDGGGDPTGYIACSPPSPPPAPPKPPVCVLALIKYHGLDLRLTLKRTVRLKVLYRARRARVSRKITAAHGSARGLPRRPSKRS